MIRTRCRGNALIFVLAILISAGILMGALSMSMRPAAITFERHLAHEECFQATLSALETTLGEERNGATSRSFWRCTVELYVGADEIKATGRLSDRPGSVSVVKLHRKLNETTAGRVSLLSIECTDEVSP